MIKPCRGYKPIGLSTCERQGTGAGRARGRPRPGPSSDVFHGSPCSRSTDSVVTHSHTRDPLILLSSFTHHLPRSFPR